MRILFFKVFGLILGSAVLLFAIVAAFFYFRADDDPFHQNPERIHQIANAAVDAYEEKGIRALNHELGRLQRHHNIRGYLMDGDGRAIGRSLPQHARQRITRFPQSILGITSPRGVHGIHAISVNTDENRNYRFVMILRSPPNRPWFFHHPILFALIFIPLASLLISALITRPLGGLKMATLQFSGGNLGARAPTNITKRNDAFGELAREFDGMGARIEKLVGEHQRLLRDVSHELRSPLSRMQVAATLLEDALAAAADSPQAQVARIQAEILRLDVLINQLLSMTRLHAGAVPLTLDEVALLPLLQSVARDAAYEFSGQGKGADVRGKGVTILADADHLRSAFENVIRNGVRYARTSLTVNLERVSESADPSQIRITVADDGPGVPAGDLENIFEPFYRPDQSRSADTGNSGLGLAIAKGIILAHGGNIAATNGGGAAGMPAGLIMTIHLPA